MDSIHENPLWYSNANVACTQEVPSLRMTVLLSLFRDRLRGIFTGTLSQLSDLIGMNVTSDDLCALLTTYTIMFMLRGERWHVWIVGGAAW